jgi:hypothetical protein
MPPSPSDIAETAGSEFGNKEQITSVEFGLPAVTSSPSKPDFVSEGMIINEAAAANAVALTSKSVKLTDRPGATTKSLYVFSNKAGAFDVQIMLDESTATWYPYLSAQAAIPNALKVITTNDLFRQVRIVFTPSGGGTAVVKAWVFSIP